MAADQNERTQMALRAAFELDAIGLALIRLQSLNDEDLAMRSLSIRVRDLAGLIVSALHDDQASVKVLRTKLTGVRTLEALELDAPTAG